MQNPNDVNQTGLWDVDAQLDMFTVRVGLRGLRLYAGIGSEL